MTGARPPADPYLDPFCQLPNRTALRMALQQALVDAKGRGLALVVVSLDSLTTVNTRYGVAIGDAYLYAWGQRLRAAIAAKGSCYYVFGAQFAVLMSAKQFSDQDTLLDQLQRWRMPLRQPFQLAEKRLEVALSWGVACAPGDGQDFDDLFANANAARSEARRLGAEDVILYSPQHRSQRQSQLEMISDLSAAIERQEFELHYQPTVDVQAGRVVGLEALIRWRHPTRGLVPPGEFIPTAEDTGLILPIGRWLLSQVLKDRKRWVARHGAAVKMSFNVSPRELAEHGFVESVDQAFDIEGGNEPDLEIEITETVMVQYPERSARILRRLQGRGFRVAIDDFGSGYASLLYLQQFPVDKIKIDRRYIDGVLGKRRERAIVVAAIQLATDLSSDVVAEGVETAEQVEALLEMGCYLMQGYHFCRPAPLDQMIAWADEFHLAPRISTVAVVA